jgi:hypothetical protein
MMPFLTTDLEQAVEEVYAADRGCEAVVNGCARPAICWQIPVNHQCFTAIPFCSTHKATWRALASGTDDATCRVCGGDFTVRWEPIR